MQNLKSDNNFYNNKHDFITINMTLIIIFYPWIWEEILAQTFQFETLVDEEVQLSERTRNNKVWGEKKRWHKKELRNKLLEKQVIVKERTDAAWNVRNFLRNCFGRTAMENLENWEKEKRIIDLKGWLAE